MSPATITSEEAEERASVAMGITIVLRVANIARVLSILFAAAVIPTISFAIIYRHGIDFPILDELDLTPLMVVAHGGHIPWAEAWRPHNGHRIFIPTLLVLGLAQLGGWSQLREMLLSTGVLTIQLAILWSLITRTLPQAIAPYAFLVASLVTFSFAQWENFFIGFQLSWFLLNCSVIFAVYQLTRPSLDISALLKAFASSVVAGLSATFGLCILPVGLVVILLRKPAKMSFALLWLLLSSGFLLEFINGYHSRPMYTGTYPTLIERLQYVLIYCGSPLGSSIGLDFSERLGLAGILINSVALYRLAFLRFSMNSFDHYLPWTAMSMFAVLCAGITSYGRAGLGLLQATASRYTLIGTDFWLGVFAVSLLLSLDAYRNRWIARPILRVAAGLAVYCLVTLIQRADINGYRAGRAFVAGIEQGVYAVENCTRPSNVQLEFLYPKSNVARIYLAELAAIGDPRLTSRAGAGSR